MPPTEEIPSLPARRGTRPRTTRTNPHAQLDQQPTDPELRLELAGRAFALPGVVERSSCISVPGARALTLANGVGAGPAEAFMCGREFAHLHPQSDSSLHLTLPVPIAAAVEAMGWGEPHVEVRTGRAPPTAMMIYAPRDTSELDTVHGILLASYRFALGDDLS